MDILKMKDELQRHISELNEIGGEWAEIKVDELEFLLDRLSDLDVTAKELETLRASNTIKQANIERLEAENETLEDKLQEQLCTVGSLLEENAKLIAERETWVKGVLIDSANSITNAQHHGCAFKGWQCFHCGEIFTTVGGARDHFGADPTKEPSCLIRIKYGNERGLEMELRKVESERDALLAEREAMMKQSLAVFFGKMPESNGKTNWTAILYRKNSDDFMGGVGDGYTLARSEYEDRVKYDADCVRYLLGEIDKEPFILDYDSDKHSGYVDPLPAQQITPKVDDKRKDSLLEYLKLQRRKLNSHYETRLKIVPSMDKEPWLSKIKKWDDWIDFVLSASQPKGDM